MISDEVFYKRIMDKFDKLDEKIQDLCDKVTKSNKKIDEHLAINDALDQKNEEDLKNRDRKFYVIMGLMGLGFTVFELSKDYIRP